MFKIFEDMMGHDDSICVSSITYLAYVISFFVYQQIFINQNKEK